MSLRTAVMVVLCMTAAFASDVDKVVPEEQFNNVQPMYQSLVQNDHDAVDEKKIDPMEDHDHMMFTPHNEEMPKVPAGAGNTEKFTRGADAQMTSAHAAKANHELKSVEDRGLAIVEGIMKKRAKEQREVEQDHKVAETMNRAAALAGVFKTDVTSFNKHKLAVDKEVLDVKAQMDIVAGFKKQLKAAEALLKKKKAALKLAKAHKMHAKYIMEVAARKYKAKKTEAIKLDKAAQERKAKAKSVKEYAEVAEKAIAKAEAAKKTVKKTKKAKKATKKGKKATKKAKKAHKKAKKAHKKAKKAHKKAKKAAKAVKKANKKAAKGKKCADCVVLDAAYAKQLKGKKNKGSCKDCPTWAKKGFCTSKLYSPFMSKFCRASCHAQNKKAANCGVSK